MSLNTISLEQAKEWAANWNKHKLDFFNKKDLKAFSIPRQVIDDVTNHKDVVDVRTYFGLDDDMNPHLMVVGVDSKGNDLIDAARGLYVYNYARPCPSNCPKAGPFING